MQKAIMSKIVSQNFVIWHTFINFAVEKAVFQYTETHSHNAAACIDCGDCEQTTADYKKHSA